MRAELARRLRAYAEKDGRGYPDWAMRYLPVLRRWRNTPLAGRRILEIGANANGFARFAGVRVIAADLALAHLREARNAQSVLPVQADAAALPFAPDTFDVCVCMDTLEHIPAHARHRAASEVGRVLAASGRGVVGFPSGAAAARAEHRVRKAYYALTGVEMVWLDEHVAIGLPEPGAVQARIEAAAGATHTVHRTGNTNALVWTWMWLVLMCGWPGRGNAVFQALLRLFTPLLARCHVRPCYRTFLWIEPRQPRE